jgi:hypothetical protein
MVEIRAGPPFSGIVVTASEGVERLLVGHRVNPLEFTLRREERGTRTGANVVAALRVAERLPANATVVTIAVDSGLRYLSTQPYAVP